MRLNTNMLILATRADDPGHGLVMAFLESNKDAVKVVGAPASREAGAKTGNSLIKRTLKELGIRADISGPVETLTQLAERYTGAFSRSESKLKIGDAFNLASAQMAGRTLVTRDIQFGKRPVDLGITDIRFVGSPENMALVARYGRSWPSPYST
jgi:predicted nucleic acid-binding protein